MSRQRRQPIKAWRYDEGYGEDRYASGDEDHSPRRRKRRRRWWRTGPLAELLALLSLLPRRHPIATALLAAAGLWLLWPTVVGVGTGAAARRPGAPEVITVFVEDPQRTVAALELWRARPGSLLVLQGRPDSQAVNRRQLGQRGVRSDDTGGVVMLTRGCDTLGQLTTLASYLAKLPQRPGRLTVVTGPAHLDRSLAIAQIVIGSAGWEVEGLPAITGDNRPEAAWRLWRDQARAQFWRVSGWDGSGDGTACRARALTERG